ncbi:MAG: hypothetical protein VKK59_03875, partial [Vampirovibrionales bacterium]|nr:hypothetical protein [Vampirovibrionales bacterium]
MSSSQPCLSPPPLSSSKKDWRQWAKVHHKTLDWQSLSADMRVQLIQSQVFQAAKAILIYWPKPHAEVDFTPLLQAYPQKAWYLPTVALKEEDGLAPSPYFWPQPLRWVSPPGVYQ